MDRPKTMANIISGIHGSIGPGRLTPNTVGSQPHWYTATITPYAAPIDSKLMNAASRAAFITGGVRDATPAVSRTRVWSVPRAVVAPGAGSLATTIRGPLKPGPNPSDSMS